MKETQTSLNGGSKKSEQDRPAGVSAAEQKRYLRVQGQLEENLIGVAGFMASVPFLQKDAISTLQFAPSLSDSWIDVCKQNKRVLEMTERYLQSSVWLPLIGVLGAYSVTIAANHGINLLAFMGVKQKPEEKKEEESGALTEEQRAQLLMMAMVQRQEARNAALTTADNL